MMASGYSPPLWQRAILPVVLIGSMLGVATYYIKAWSQVDELWKAGSSYLLGAPRSADRAGVARAVAAIPGVAADPLNQQLVTGMIAARAQRDGDRDRTLREAAILRQLGWRSTSALQNMLWRGSVTTDLPLIMDTLDALLRRQKLLEYIHPVLNLMTTDPVFRPLLVSRVEGRPSWRYYYFLSAADLKKPNEIEGRYEVMRAVQTRGDRLTRNEVAPILPRLISIGRSAQAFALWRAHNGAVTSPLADIHFAKAAQQLPSDALPVSFEWQLGNGSGYYADVSRDEGGNFLSLDWNGRGTPSFVSQVTSATPGRYTLSVTGDAGIGDLSKRLGFRLVCTGGKAVEFVAVGAARGRRQQFVTAGAVPCSFPTLELYGLVHSGMAAGTTILRSIRMTRVDG